MKLQQKLLATLTASLFSAASYATPQAVEDEAGIILTNVEVTAQRIQRTDMQIETAQSIKKKPTSNGNITELLRVNPNVQFSSAAKSGYSAGEIKPEDVSFHGMPYYTNNFTIDGLSNNDIMHPGASNGTGVLDYASYINAPTSSLPPGNPQSFYVDSSLVETVKAYDSNVPAKYSNFTGGVVDAELKQPNLQKASGSISFRTTRDNWTHMVKDEDVEDPLTGDADSRNSGQPEFVKRHYHVDINQPLSEKLGILFAYDRTESKIPKEHLISGIGKENERRLSQTFLLKGLYHLDDHDHISASIMYSPHKDHYIPTNMVKDGALDISGGGYQLAADWAHEFDWAKVNTKIAYSQKSNKRNWDSDTDFIQHLNANYGWCSGKYSANCTAREGGYPGDETKNSTFTLKQDWETNPLHWIGDTKHQLAFGWQIERANAEYTRKGDFDTYYSKPASVTGVDLTDCIYCNKDAGWYLVSRNHNPKTHNKAGVNTYGAYLSDSITWKRLTVTPALRIDHDEFLSNTNFAPRFAFDIDATGDNRTHIFGGANRYYSGNMVYYALRAGFPDQIFYNNTSGALMRKPNEDWTIRNTRSYLPYKNMTNLNTPYSDELNIGWAQKFGNNNKLTLKWVYRNSKDQFKQDEDDDGNKIITNNGKARGKTLSLEVASEHPYRWGDFELGYHIGARYFTTRNNNRYAYDNESFEDMFDWKAIVDNQLLDPDKIPVLNFNQKWSAFLELDTALPKWGLTWTHRLNFADGYKAYVSSPVNCSAGNAKRPSACGAYTGRAYEYTPTDFKDAFTLDWRINWAIPMGGKKKLDLTLDVLNVTDNKKVGTNTGSAVNGTMQAVSGYETGRQFWLGATYRW